MWRCLLPCLLMIAACTSSPEVSEGVDESYGTTGEGAGEGMSDEEKEKLRDDMSDDPNFDDDSSDKGCDPEWQQTAGDGDREVVQMEPIDATPPELEEKLLHLWDDNGHFRKDKWQEMTHHQRVAAVIELARRGNPGAERAADDLKNGWMTDEMLREEGPSVAGGNYGRIDVLPPDRMGAPFPTPGDRD